MVMRFGRAAVGAALTLLLCVTAIGLLREARGIGLATAPPDGREPVAESPAGEDDELATVEVLDELETAPARTAGEVPDALASTEDAGEQDSAGTVDRQSLIAPRIGGTFTGDAELDLPDSDPNVVIVVDAGGQGDVGLPNSAPAGTVSGWDLKDVRFLYDRVTDQMIVGINSFGVIGDPDGNGDPSSFAPWPNINATDVPDMGPDESVIIAFDLNEDGDVDVLAGVPEDRLISEFAIAAPAFGGIDAGDAANDFFWDGDLRTNPVFTTPTGPTSGDLVFVIDDFSTLPGTGDDLDFSFTVFLGGGNTDAGVGEETGLGTGGAGSPVNISARIGDFVWLDGNADGFQTSESGIDAVTVNLLDAEGTVVDTATTDADGGYEFVVAPGDYRIGVVPPAGFSFTTRDAGGDAADGNDSDVDRSNGRTGVITVRPGDDIDTIDAGLVEFVPDPSIDLEKATNDVDSDLEPGENLVVGTEAFFTYVIRNTGNVPLIDVALGDDQIPELTCMELDEIESLAPGASVTCTTSTPVTAGQYTNIGTVTATAADDDLQPLAGFAPDSITDTDPSNHFGILSAIDIEKSTNDIDADEPEDGPELFVDDLVQFRYVVTNIGNVTLVDVEVTDDVLGGVVCTIGRLEPRESQDCLASDFVEAGEYKNIGTAVGQPIVDGKPFGDPVTAEDPSHHVGIVPGPACEATITGPRLFRGSTTIDETGWVAAPGSSIVIVTEEPGGSPKQPREQVYVRVGTQLFGPTPVGLGELEFTVAAGGPVTILHVSEIEPELTGSNSVEYRWCGDELTRDYVQVCPDAVAGPRMWQDAIVHWDSGLIAEAGSTIEVTTSEPGESPGQPHEQVFLIVGDEEFDLTDPDHRTNTYVTRRGGPVSIKHASERIRRPGANSVEFTLCGTGLYEN